MGVVSPKSGNWTVQNGQLRQSNDNGNGFYALVPVSANDYVVETRVTIHRIEGVSQTEGAGLGVRVQSPASQWTPAQYICIVSPDTNQFVLGRCNGTQQYCAALSTSPLAISLDTAYRIRARVQGSTLTCELPDHNRTLTANNLTWASGDVSLLTLYAEAFFDYLTVTGL